MTPEPLLWDLLTSSSVLKSYLFLNEAALLNTHSEILKWPLNSTALVYCFQGHKKNLLWPCLPVPTLNVVHPPALYCCSVCIKLIFVKYSWYSFSSSCLQKFFIFLQLKTNSTSLWSELCGNTLLWLVCSKLISLKLYKKQFITPWNPRLFIPLVIQLHFNHVLLFNYISTMSSCPYLFLPF